MIYYFLAFASIFTDKGEGFFYRVCMDAAAASHVKTWTFLTKREEPNCAKVSSLAEGPKKFDYH